MTPSQHERTARFIGFDYLGGRRRRIDDRFDLEDPALTPYRQTFKQVLRYHPGAFIWELPVVDLRSHPRDARHGSNGSRSAIEPVFARLEWQSALVGCAIAHLFWNKDPAALSIFLAGVDRQSEMALIDSVAELLAARPGSTFRPAFDLFRAALDRPLIATLRFHPLNHEKPRATIAAIERSLACNYFTPPPAATSSQTRTEKIA